MNSTRPHDLQLIFTEVYTWFPEGKVVFVAPTKPLVAQQIEACHRTCGIPGSHAAELTGQTPRPMRAKAVSRPRSFRPSLAVMLIVHSGTKREFST